MENRFNPTILTLSLEGDGECGLAVGVADRAVVVGKVGGHHVADDERAAHAVRATTLLHAVVAANLDKSSTVNVGYSVIGYTGLIGCGDILGIWDKCHCRQLSLFAAAFDQ